MLSMLGAVEISLLQEGFAIDLGWLEKFIRILIEGIGITGVGIIVFTLILKAITLPFDIYQRVKMRKQTLIMRNMQPELEKLQKQYANDKNMYSQKMMELYKKNGYSMFGACLPMIISMIILIVAFSSLNTYSQYANLAMYENMAHEYNAYILSNSITEEEAQESEIWEETRDGETFVVIKSSAAEKFVFVEYNKGETNPTMIYKIDTDKLYVLEKETIDGLISASETSLSVEQACKDFVIKNAGLAAAESYRNNPPSFLWIKNIWYPDVSYDSPIQSYEKFVGQLNSDMILADGTEIDKKEIKTVVTEQFYNSITAQLTEEKDQANGYFILIILSIGLMVLSQFITMKSQKESNQYQTADGSGMKQQKIMMIMMPLIYAIFAFMYSSAFSLYMTMSSVIGILVTVISNVVIGRIFAIKEAEEVKKKYTRELPAYMRKKDDNKKK